MRNIYNFDKLPACMNVGDVALIFAVSEPTVRYWIRTGKLNATRLGKRYYVYKDNVIALFEGGAVS